MIRSKQDLHHYLERDRISLNKRRKRPRIVGDEVWVFQVLLRKEEYHTNVKNKIRAAIYKVRRHRLGVRLGFSVPINVFGPGLSIAHYGTLVINKDCRIGENCRIHVDVNIGTKAGESGQVACIGDNAYIGPGVKIFGKVKLGNNIAIGANSVVNKSFPEGNCTIAGIPAKVISEKNSQGLWLKPEEIEALKNI